MEIPLFPGRRLLFVLALFTAVNALAQPKIASFSPASGPVGSTVTITGMGFNATPAANTVYFGAVKGVVTGGSATSLSVTVPAGATYQPLTVLNNATGLSAYASQPFITTFANPFETGFPVNFYQPPILLSSPSSFTYIYDHRCAVGDLDGDGKPDLVVPDGYNSIAVLRNISTTASPVTAASFAPKVIVATTYAPVYTAISDIDGDGKLDIVVYGGSSSFSVLRNTSTVGDITASSFSQRVDFYGGPNAFSLAINDIDGDGKPDIVVGSETLTTYRNTSTPGTLSDQSFSSRIDLNPIAGSTNRYVALTDMDGDSRPDLVVCGPDKLSILRNVAVPGSITLSSFTDKTEVSEFGNPASFATGDLNRDGKSEIIFARSKLVVLPNTTAGSGAPFTLGDKVELPVFSNTYSTAIGDVDGDGTPDIVVANLYSPSSVSVLRNLSANGSVLTAASFAERVDFSDSSELIFVLAADMNGDGIPELLTNSSSSVYVRNLNAPAPPVIGSFSPAAAPAGSTVTITGTNFNTNPAGNIVYFGAVRVAVTAASATSLTVAIPPGTAYAPVSVLNTGTGLMGYSTRSFAPAFNNPFGNSIPNGFYLPKIDLAAGTAPHAVATGDLDGDGKPELVVANNGSNTVSVLRNLALPGTIAASSFAPKVDFATGAAPRSVVLSDLDGDGKLDIVVANAGSNTVSVLRNMATTGSITVSSFAAKVDFAVGAQPLHVAVGDVNSDGRPDIGVANLGSNTVSVLRNTVSFAGSITATSFAAAVDFATGTAPASLAFSDVNGDGKPELVVANYGSNTVSVLQNTSTAKVITATTFAPQADFAAGTGPIAVLVDDMDGDGKPDLAVANAGSNSVSVLRNGPGTGNISASFFAEKADFPVGTTPRALFIGDADGNGKPDLIAANYSSGTITVLQNTAAGGNVASFFTNRTDFVTSAHPLGVAMGDLDGDGNAELAAAGEAGVVSVFKIDASSVLPPVVSSLNPTKGPINAAVTISGANFDPNPANNIVYFGAVRATITSATATSLAATVPAGATYKPVSVLNNVTRLSGSSPQPFSPTFTNPFGMGMPRNFYNPPVRLRSSRGPFAFDIGDLDGDGKPDLAVAYSTSTVAVLRNISATGTLDSSSFASEISFTTGFIPYYVSAADVDGDGKLDLIVANDFGNTVSVLRNTSTPGSIDASSFAPKVDFVTGHAPTQVEVSDVDGDGRPDLLLNSSDGNFISILRNISTPGSITASSFAPKVDIVIGPFSSQRSFAFSDVDGDGKPDLIGITSNNISVLRNVAVSGSISVSSFAAKVDFPITYNPADYPFGFPGLGLVLAGDIDGDGKLDLTTFVGGNPSKLAILRNTSTPGSITLSSFAPEVDVTFSGGLGLLGDVDGDGKPDFVGSNPVTIVRNLCTPGNITPSSFAAPATFPSDPSIMFIRLGDLDGDGLAEIVTGNGNTVTGFISILKINSSQSGSTSPISIASFIPASGPVGTTVTITGTGFGTNAASNLVYFGAVKAAITSASATSLAVTVPAGATYGPPSVLNTATGLSASAPRPFIPTFTNPFGAGAGVTNNFYLPGIKIPEDNSVLAAAVGDFDGDGKPDLAVGKSTGLDVLRSNVTGTINSASFNSRINIPPSFAVNFVATGDLDGDGRLDLVTLRNNSGGVYVYPNGPYPNMPGMYGFFYNALIFTGSSPRSAAIGDLDGDGKPDLAVSNTSGSVSVFFNTSTPGSISFAAAVNFAAGSSPRSVAIGDLDGDGKPELVVANASSGTLSVLRNISIVGRINAISFEPKVDFATAPNPFFVAISDINNDGRPDLIAANNTKPGLVSVLQNAGDPVISTSSFGARADFPVADYRGTGAIGDVDGDGRPDVIAAASGSLSVLRNTGATGNISASSFNPSVDFNPGGSSAVAMADLDLDGIPEIVSANSYLADITVLKMGSPQTLQVPKISSFGPSSSPTGTTVTITGTGFDATPSNNVVFFGTARAVVTGGSSTSLAVLAPAGTTNGPLSVLNNANGLSGAASKFFITQFNNPFGQGNMPADFYKPTIELATNTLPYYAALGDIDRDNRPEIIVANSSSNNISIIRNTATGNLTAASFGSRINFAVGADPRAVAVGDLDGDGTPEIVAANAGAGSLSVLRNLTSLFGSVSFAAPVEFATGASPFSVAVADVDGDGRSDLVVANLSSGTVSVLRNTTAYGVITAGSFAPRVDYAVGAYPRFVAVTDLDGDGKPEIAVVNERSNTLSVLRNTAMAGTINAASFAPMAEFATGNSPNCLVASDLDGDGKNDLVVCNYGSNTVSVLRNTATAGTIDAASFAAKVDYATGAQPFFVAAGDADGDGKPDLAVVSSSAGTASLLRNTGVPGSIDASSFAPPVSFTVGGYPVSVALGDLDANGNTELVAVNAGSNTVSVLPINEPLPPVITSITPDKGPAGSSTTITGANFNPNPSANTVYFGAVKATVTGGSANNLTVNVPAGATYQSLSVLNNPTGLAGYSQLPFIPTFSHPFGSGIPTNFYKPKVDVAAGALPFYTAIADLDGDGKPDLVVANAGASTVSVLRNISSGGGITATSFAPALNLPAPADPRSLVITDVDRDGKPDIVIAGASSYTVSVLHNISSPGALTAASFAARVDFPAGTYVSSLAAGDIDGDGRPDLLATNFYSGRVLLLRNVSTLGTINAGSFVDWGNYLYAYGGPRFVTLSDLDGDGRPDAILASEQENTITIYRNNAVIGMRNDYPFDYRALFNVGMSPSCVAAGDIDGDGKPDLVVVNYGSNNVAVLRNISTAGSITEASFAAPVFVATGSNPFFAALGDADGDGKADIIVANANPNIGSVTNTFTVLRNTATAGSITAASFNRTDFAAGGYPDCAAIGDLDGDGAAELVLANAATNAVSVFQISQPAATVAATGAAPVQATAAVEQPKGSMQLYPNPTRGSFTLQLQGSKAGMALVEVINESGTAIEKRTVNRSGKAAMSLQFNLRGQLSGAYYVKVTGVDGVQVAKVVVQR